MSASLHPSLSPAKPTTSNLDSLPNLQISRLSKTHPPPTNHSLTPLNLFKHQPPQPPPSTPKHRDSTSKKSSSTPPPDLHHNIHRPPPAPASAATSLSCSNPMFSSTPFLVSFFLFLSLPLLFLLGPRFLPPSHPTVPISPADELDDQILFSRALNPNPNRPKPTFSHLALDSKSSKPKIAFLFLTNTDLHFAPLWSRFFSKTNPNLYNIYVHADPSANVTLPPGTVFHNRLVPSKRTYRASATLISATRRLLASAVIDDPANMFFAVLSQHCVPLHSFRYVYHSLFFSTTFDLTRPAADSDDAELTRMGLKIRYKSFIEIISKSTNLWKRYSARGRFAMMPEVPFDQFRVGSQFFLLTRHHALVVLKDRALWRKFRVPCYREDECYPEEHYFPTLLSMADPEGVTRYTLTRVNWTGTVNGHPYTYRSGEVSAELIYRLRKSNFSESYLFARKFSPDCLKPLLDLADKVIFRD